MNKGEISSSEYELDKPKCFLTLVQDLFVLAENSGVNADGFCKYEYLDHVSVPLPEQFSSVHWSQNFLENTSL